MGNIFPGGHHSVVLELEKLAMEEHMTKEKMKDHRDDLVKDVDWIAGRPERRPVVSAYGKHCKA